MDDNSGEMLPLGIGLRAVEVKSVGDAKGASGAELIEEVEEVLEKRVRAFLWNVVSAFGNDPASLGL